MIIIIMIEHYVKLRTISAGSVKKSDEFYRNRLIICIMLENIDK